MASININVQYSIKYYFYFYLLSIFKKKWPERRECFPMLQSLFCSSKFYPCFILFPDSPHKQHPDPGISPVLVDHPDSGQGEAAGLVSCRPF